MGKTNELTFIQSLWLIFVRDDLDLRFKILHKCECGEMIESPPLKANEFEEIDGNMIVRFNKCKCGKLKGSSLSTLQKEGAEIRFTSMTYAERDKLKVMESEAVN